MTIEDLLPAALYGMAVKQYLSRWYEIKLESTHSAMLESKTFGKEGVVAACETVFENALGANQKKYDKRQISLIELDWC